MQAQELDPNQMLEIRVNGATVGKAKREIAEAMAIYLEQHGWTRLDVPEFKTMFYFSA